MSSIRLFGTMRPTNRKFVRPSRSIFSSAGCGGASVMRAVSTAIGITPVLENPISTSSRRLYSESPSASSVVPASVASS